MLIRSLYIFVRNENGIWTISSSFFRGKLSDRREPWVNKEINASLSITGPLDRGDGTIVRLIDRGGKGGGGGREGNEAQVLIAVSLNIFSSNRDEREREREEVPFSSWLLAEYVDPSSTASHSITSTKSATKLGTRHFKVAVLPRKTNSSMTLVS